MAPSTRSGTSRAEDFVVLYPVAERGLVGVEHEMLDRYAVFGEAIADLPPVALDQDSHRHDERASGVLEHAPSGFDNERSPWLPVLEVVRCRKSWLDVHEHLADLLSVEDARVGQQLLHELARRRLSRPVRAVEPNDHGPNSNARKCFSRSVR